MLIETHPELGERILAPIEQLEHVRPIVRACHERFDGKGYPDRLAGEEIPLEARIIFVCDAFHAMTTTRPYREALPVEEARRRLIEAAGSQFDPAIVEVCLRVLEAPRSDGSHAAASRGRTSGRARSNSNDRPAPATSTSAHRHLPCPGSSSGSAVDSSSAQRRPKRAGGSRKESVSCQALKRTRNESSTIGSPSRVSAVISAPLRNAPSAKASPRSQSRPRHRPAVGPEPPDVGRTESSCSLPVRNVGRRKTGCARRSAISRCVNACSASARVVELPVDPAELVVLAVGVVVAALRAAELVAGEQHRHPLREQERGEEVAELAVAERVHRRDRPSPPRRRSSTTGCRWCRPGSPRGSRRCASRRR